MAVRRKAHVRATLSAKSRSGTRFGPSSPCCPHARLGGTRLASPTLDHLMLANARQLQNDSKQRFDSRLVRRHTCTRRERSCGLSRPRGLRMDQVRGAWHAHYITAWKGGESSAPLAQRALDNGDAVIGRPMGVRGRGGTHRRWCVGEVVHSTVMRRWNRVLDFGSRLCVDPLPGAADVSRPCCSCCACQDDPSSRECIQTGLGLYENRRLRFSAGEVGVTSKYGKPVTE